MTSKMWRCSADKKCNEITQVTSCVKNGLAAHIWAKELGYAAMPHHTSSIWRTSRIWCVRPPTPVLMAASQQNQIIWRLGSSYWRYSGAMAFLNKAAVANGPPGSGKRGHRHNSCQLRREPLVRTVQSASANRNIEDGRSRAENTATQFAMRPNARTFFLGLRGLRPFVRHSAWTGSLHVLQLKQTSQIWKLCFRHFFWHFWGLDSAPSWFRTQTNTPPEVNGGLEDFREGNLSGAMLNFGGACSFIHIHSGWNAQVEQDDISIKLAENISQTLQGCKSKGAFAAYCLMSLRAFVTEPPKGIHVEPRQTGAEWGRVSWNALHCHVFCG